MELLVRVSAGGRGEGCGGEEMAETESDNDSWETLEESSDTEDQQDKKVRSTKRFCCKQRIILLSV